MTTLFTIDLTINMPDGGRHARQLLNLYFPDMPDDINASALALCEVQPLDPGSQVLQTDRQALRRLVQPGTQPEDLRAALGL